MGCRDRAGRRSCLLTRRPSPPARRGHLAGRFHHLALACAVHSRSSPCSARPSHQTATARITVNTVRLRRRRAAAGAGDHLAGAHHFPLRMSAPGRHGSQPDLHGAVSVGDLLPDLLLRAGAHRGLARLGLHLPAAGDRHAAWRVCDPGRAVTLRWSPAVRDLQRRLLAERG